MLHKALNDALPWGLVTRNVADAVDAPAVPKVDDPTPSRQQARQLRTEARAHRLFAFYRMALTTGLRQGEILALRWSDVDWDAGTVSVARAQKDIVDGIPVYGKTKAKRARSKVHLDPRDLTDLAAHRERQRLEQARAGSAWHPGDLTFCREDGTALSAEQAGNFFKRLLRAAGLPPRMRSHDLRHTNATLLMEAGGPVLVVSERLGHSTPTTTEAMYGHVTAPMRSAAAAKMADILALDDPAAEDDPRQQKTAR